MASIAARKNPYIYGPPVGNSSAFVEREDIFQFVVNALQNENQETVCLYGQRRIGKTTVLQHLCTHLPQRLHCHTVLFDLQGKANLTLERVLTELAHAIAQQLNMVVLNSRKSMVESFSTEFMPSVMTSLPIGEPLVLMFDEFDTLTDVGADQAESSLFLFLRSLILHYPGRLKYVFVLGRHVGELSALSLVLFKNTKFKHVSLLPKGSAISLIQLAEKNHTLRWDEQAIERVWQLTHGHSLLTQAVCSEVWNQAYFDEPEETPCVHVDNVNEAIPDVMGSCYHIMDWLWGSLDQSERIVASAIAQAGKSSVSLPEIFDLIHKSGARILIRDMNDAPRILQEWDLIEVDSAGGYRYRVELVRMWVQTNWPLSRVQKIMDRNQPVVENLYQAARGLESEKKLDEAAATLVHALELNPRHSQSCERLADIYIRQNKLWEARLLLERVVNILPKVAHPRLVEIYLTQAAYEKDEEEQLNLYAMVLNLDPGNQEAEEETIKIYERRGEETYRQGEYFLALENFRKAGNDEMVGEITQLIQEQEALEKTFREGLAALEERDYTRAQAMFEQVISVNKDFAYQGQKATDLHEQSKIEAQTIPGKMSKWLRQPANITLLAVALVVIIVSAAILMFLAGEAPRLNANQVFATATVTPPLPVSIDTPLPAAGPQISAENASQVVQWSRWDVLQTLGLSFSPDGKTLATGSLNSVVMVWDVTSGKLTRSLAGHSSWVRTVAFSSNKNTLASGADDGTIRLWNLSDGSLIRSFNGSAGLVNSIAFSPDQSYLAAGTGSGGIEIWEVKTGKLLRTLKGHSRAVRSVAFTSNGAWLISGSDDETVRMWVWQSETGPLMTLTGHTNAVTSIAVSSDNQWVASGSKDKSIRIWNVNDGKIFRALGSTRIGIMSVDFSRDNQLLAAAAEDGTIQLWNVENGKKLVSLSGHERPVTSLTFTPDGRSLASASEDKIFIWAIPQP